jgi:hypothetical protein
MRLWTIHPKYLDAKGLTALWREGLLARAVLHGKTKGYTKHPQLIRFRAHPVPLAAIDAYLAGVLVESRSRGYHFDASKINETAKANPIAETTGQLAHEWNHLLKKLQSRDKERWEKLKSIATPDQHALFLITNGAIQDWEKGQKPEQT